METADLFEILVHVLSCVLCLHVRLCKFEFALHVRLGFVLNRFTRMRLSLQPSFVSFCTKYNRNLVMGFGNACGRTDIRVYLLRVIERMCTVPHLSDSSCVDETQQRRRSRKHMTGLCAAYRCGWIMHHDLKTPTNPVWHLMEFLISVNKALLSRGWTVRGRFVLFLSALIWALWDRCRCQHHLLLHPQCAKLALSLLHKDWPVARCICHLFIHTRLVCDVSSLCFRISLLFTVPHTCAFGLANSGVWYTPIYGVIQTKLSQSPLYWVLNPWAR